MVGCARGGNLGGRVVGYAFCPLVDYSWRHCGCVEIDRCIPQLGDMEVPWKSQLL
jgi:hypothetical protein